MTYESIKTIRGRRYLYRVTSYRDPASPGKVLKRMEYGGPVDGYLYDTQKTAETSQGTAKDITAPIESPQTLPQEPQTPTQAQLPEKVKTSTTGHKRGQLARTTKARPIDSRISFRWIRGGWLKGLLTGKSSKGISSKSLVKDYKKTISWLRSVEINPTSFPQIVLTYGKLGHRKKRYDIGGFPLRPMQRKAVPYYEVSIPLLCRGKKERFREHYHMALAKAMLVHCHESIVG